MTRCQEEKGTSVPEHFKLHDGDGALIPTKTHKSQILSEQNGCLGIRKPKNDTVYEYNQVYNPYPKTLETDIVQNL